MNPERRPLGPTELVTELSRHPGWTLQGDGDQLTITRRYEFTGYAEVMAFANAVAQLTGKPRNIYGFDSFAGFPQSKEVDRKADGSFQTERGDYASPPELVLKVLEEGRVSSAFVAEHVRLVRGFFENTLPSYTGSIALLHLDCDLYESYRTCLNLLYDRVSPGGLIMFDEYEDETFPGARIAVDEHSPPSEVLTWLEKKYFSS